VAGAVSGLDNETFSYRGIEMDKLETLEGVLSGAALAAAAGFAREGDETQRKLRIARDDASKALRELEDLNSRGDVVRSRMPAVMDFMAGLSIAHQPSPAPSLTPSLAGLTRPDLAANMATAVADLKWPPKPGQYDERGNIITVGELTALASALTCEEVRALVQGFVQSRQPAAAHKVQIYYAANALISVLEDLNLSRDQHVEVWKGLFAGAPGGASETAGGAAPHRLTSSPPVAQVVDPGIASVMPLGQPELVNYPYTHQNTDQASKWRVTLGANVAAGTTAFQVTFGTHPWLREGKPYQPVVVCSSPLFAVAVVTSNGFTVKTVQGLSAASIVDLGFAVCAG
jgi:hypothetical protein